MIATSHNKQQRASDRGAGAARVGECDRSSSIAPHQNRNRGYYPARVPSLARLDPALVLHLPGLRAPAFYAICRGDLQARQRRLGFPSLGRAANLNLSGAIRSGSRTQLHLGHHVLQDTADVPEAYHLERPSSLASDVHKHSERHIPHVRESVGEVRND